MSEHTRNQKRMYRIHKQEEKILEQELMIASLQQKVEQQENEINRLNNIINELEKWLEDNLGNCRTNQNYTSDQIYNLKEDAYYRCLNRLKELKEDEYGKRNINTATIRLHQ